MTGKPVFLHDPAEHIMPVSGRCAYIIIHPAELSDIPAAAADQFLRCHPASGHMIGGNQRDRIRKAPVQSDDRPPQLLIHFRSQGGMGTENDSVHSLAL